MPRGGSRKPGPGKTMGPDKKPKEEKAQRIVFYAPPDLAAKLQKHGGKSKLIQRLLWAYFEAKRPPET